MRLFALNSSRVFGEKIASCLDCKLDVHEERDFEDGEHKIRPLVSVRDEDVYVIHSMYTDDHESVNDKLCRLLFFIAVLKDCGARRVTAVVPYLCYARKDRKTKARDPVTMRYMAALFEASNVDAILTIDVHNLQAYQNSFRCRTEHLEAQNAFVSFFRAHIKPDESVVVMSPDIGGIKRAEQFRDKLSKALAREAGFAFMEKMRSKGVITGEAIAGDVKGKKIIILDDLINSGSTLARAAAACNRAGAKEVVAAATHGVFTSKISQTLTENSLSKIIVTNTVTLPIPAEMRSKILTVDIAPLFAEAVKRLGAKGSLVSLMEIE